MLLLAALLCVGLVNGQHQYQSPYSHGVDYSAQAAAQQYASAAGGYQTYQPTATVDYGQQPQIVSSPTSADYSQSQYQVQQQQPQQQQQLQYPYQPAYPSPYAPQPTAYSSQQQQQQQQPQVVDQKNVQRYAQYLDILQKSYGIQVPTQQSVASPYTASAQVAQQQQQSTAYQNPYGQQKPVYPSYPTAVAQPAPAPQTQKSPYTVYPAPQPEVQSPYTYGKPAEAQPPYTYSKPAEAQSPYTYSKPAEAPSPYTYNKPAEAQSPYAYAKPEVAYPQPAPQIQQPTVIQQRPYVPQAPSTHSPVLQPFQPPYNPAPAPQPQPYAPAPAQQTYIRPESDLMSQGYPQSRQTIENTMPQQPAQPAGYPYQQSKIEMPEEADYNSNSVVEAPLTLAPQPEKPVPVPQPPQSTQNSLTGEQPLSVASATSVQALTQQIRRLPAVLYVDSRDPQAKRTEALLRETYGLPLVAFYVDKIDQPRAVEKNLKHLTAHEGMPYLFICGTFIGSQQHIDNYHSNKQIPQLVEYVCGDEKKRKMKKST